MAQQDQLPTAVGSNHVTANAIEGAMNSVTAASKTIQAMASEIFDIARETIDHATLTMDKLRSTQVMDQIVAIQTDYVKDAFAYARPHMRRFHELFSGFPAEITKSYQDVWLKAVNAGVMAVHEASQTTADNVRSYSEAARKSASVFEHRETPYA